MSYSPCWARGGGGGGVTVKHRFSCQIPSPPLLSYHAIWVGWLGMVFKIIVYASYCTVDHNQLSKKRERMIRSPVLELWGQRKLKRSTVYIVFVLPNSILLKPEIHTKRQATQRDCLPSLLGSGHCPVGKGDTGIEILYIEEKNILFWAD